MKTKILIAEDNIEFLEILSYFLTEQAYEVHAAQNGQEALDYLQENPVDIILSDLKMPIVSGDELLRGVLPKIIKGQPAFIFMTGTPHLISSENKFKVLKKPFTFEALLDALKDSSKKK